MTPPTFHQIRTVKQVLRLPQQAQELQAVQEGQEEQAEQEVHYLQQGQEPMRQHQSEQRGTS